MKYLMKSGVLYQAPDCALAKLKGIFIGPEKNVYLADGSLVLTITRKAPAPSEKQGADVRSHVYVMCDTEGREIAEARPGYAEGDDPTVTGWPVNRMPRVDHAAVTLAGKTYTLVMQNSQNYTLETSDGAAVVQILHRGLVGGWNLTVNEDFPPEILCGLFAFCRYIEQENELLVV